MINNGFNMILYIRVITSKICRKGSSFFPFLNYFSRLNPGPLYTCPTFYVFRFQVGFSFSCNVLESKNSCVLRIFIMCDSGLLCFRKPLITTTCSQLYIFLVFRISAFLTFRHVEGFPKHLHGSFYARAPGNINYVLPATLSS
jgi:hypothetical protein